MRQSLPNIALFIVLAGGLIGGWWYVDKTFFPKPEPKQPEPLPPPREAVQGLAGGLVGVTQPANGWPASSTPDVRAAEKPKEPAKPAEPTKASPAEPIELIVLGDAESFTRVYFTTRGGAIQRVELTRFEEADRLGREVKAADGTRQPLPIIPGFVRRRDRVSLSQIHANPGIDEFPSLAPGVVPPDVAPLLSEPSYALLHYPAEDDPLRSAKDGDHPSAELATRSWKVVERSGPAGGEGGWKVVFETTLDAPYFLKLRKTYTLSPKEYHVGFTLDVVPQPGRVRGKGLFRYQIAGPLNLPVEGEWYTSTYRNALIGSVNGRGGVLRDIQDAASIQSKHGGDRVDRGENTFAYMAVATQYFASAIAVDDTQPASVRGRMWEYVRPTREPHPGDVADQPFLSDVTVRAVSAPLDPAPDEPATHKYLIYDGPIKVRLLKMMSKEEDVVEAGLVDRYLNNLSLKTMSDYHSPNVFGRIANAVWWSDVVIGSTNLMHSVLYGIHRWLGLPWGLAIILLTICVRLALMLPSRKQQAMMARMQEKMARMKPEVDKLQEKYKDNPQLLQQEKTRLMLQHGVNPVSTMSGCLLLFAQMPVFMGLYFCLQESVFFRLQDFLWVPNLAAPDMTVWLSEWCPYLCTPDNLGGSVYLGPFFNILPLISTGLIFTQQRLTMPPPTDEMQEQQQKMMKFMIIFMAVFFYKVPAGLCLYFICSTSWALMERKLIPKPKAKLPDPPTPLDRGGGKSTAPVTPTPTNGPAGGGFMSRMKAKMEDMQRQADEQSRRQIRNGPPAGHGQSRDRDKDKKRKKK